jgi:DNA-binding NarL/FixJ family response regulator
MISVAVISNVRLYREGLADILGRQPDIAVLDNGHEDPASLATLVRAKPDVVVLDMTMPASAEIARDLATTAPNVMVVALGVLDREAHVLTCAELGIGGYVSRDGGVEDLLTVVRRVATGEALYPPRVIAALVQRFALRTAKQETRPASRLTARELEIVELIDRGMTNKEIAAHLSVELATVKNHVHHIFEKLHIHRRAEVASWIRVQRKANGVET